MADTNSKKRDLIEGRPALIVIDIQKSTFAPIPDDERSIAHMPDYADRMARSKVAIDKAREVGIPVIFIQEIHRADLVDFGRELDGDESIHCLDSNPLTAFAEEELGMRPDDYRISKRRYSAFYGTDLEILLRGLKAETLILVGGLTDVCVHYTFVDAHQGDYFCRVIEDCVAGSSLAAHQASLNAMEYLQHGAIRSIDEVLAAMTAQA
ncbi:cysteine hydrolase family protein [Marivita geojedonensis]|uniref:Cysteine hydrolase n=1 Tax=Marivita geojedonensis TaxID=1123756 RepID=A0A1X4NJL3_9RHOB|nr:cysteine hydrolase [Marivita geojedonensis]OSQ49773.1 cysteine hydrolase [Marivita geojedonensis]PRY75856.1 nicotinamidase-related amidase [Marivita geojedonensis]